MSIDRTAYRLRHPGSYLAAGAVHGGMGLMTILFKMAVVWPLLLCWWMSYGIFWLMWMGGVAGWRWYRGRQVRHGHRPPNAREQQAGFEAATARSRAHFARPQAPYWQPPAR
jgi:hypothetical protein